MSFEGLQERLTALQETAGQLRELIDRLQNLHFQPGSVPLGAEDDNVSTELSAEISQILREEDDELELLQEEVADLRDGRPGSEAEHTKRRLTEGMSRLKEELRSSRLVFRKAQLAAKRNLAQAQRLERELLLQSYSQPTSGMASPRQGTSEDGDADGNGTTQRTGRPESIRHRHGHQQQHQTSALPEKDQQVVGASGNVTSALRRAHDLMAAELARSEFAHRTLKESSAALAQLDESYGSLEGMLASSKDLLVTLVRSQKSDTWYLQTAFYMLLTTGAWLLFRRFLYGPMWWFVWLPIRLLYGLVTGTGSAVMRYGGSGKNPAGLAGEDTAAVANVKGIPGDELPTLDVQGQAAESSRPAGDSGSMAEKIAMIVENPADVYDDVQEDGGEEISADDQFQDVPVVEQQRDEL